MPLSMSVLKKSMEDRFKDLENNILYAECTILHPRFKKRGLGNHRACEVAIQGLRNRIGRVQLLGGNREVSVTTPSVASASSSSSIENGYKKDSIWDAFDQEINKIIRPDNQVAAGIRELDKYLNEEYLERKKDPLQCWYGRRHLYPHLYA